MSVSRAQRIGLGALVVLATGAVGYAVVTGSAGGSEPTAETGGTVVATPTKAVDVVPQATAAQAAQAVSTRLFERSDVAVLTASDAASKTAAIATAERLKVPVLADDPAAPAELARLRAETVLTFGETGSVVGATPITGDAAAAQTAVDEAVGDHEPPAAPETPTVVLMKSAKDFDLAAATARAAGATVVETAAADPRTDPQLAATLATTPDSPVVAVGAPFSDALEYTVAAVQNEATQLDGSSYLALRGTTYVALHGQTVEQATTTFGTALPSHTRAARAVNNPAKIVGMLEVPATGVDVKTLTATAEAAAKAKIYTVLALTPSDDASWADQVRGLEDVLTLPHVGLSLEPDAKGIPATEVNEVAGRLTELVRSEILPQKVFIIHTSAKVVITDRSEVETTHPELATLIQVDTPGNPQTKLAAWQNALTSGPRGAYFGWTNLEQDGPMFSINQTWRYVRPNPLVISYR